MANIGMDLYLAYEDGYKKGKADAVVHGHWTDDDKCSACGDEPLYEYDVRTLKYCPNCGARMDEE